MIKSTFIFKTYQVMAVLAVAFFAQIANAQYVSDYKKTADTYYAKGDYYSAAVYYEKFLNPADGEGKGGGEPYTIQKKGGSAKAVKEDVNNQEIIYRIAESYRKINDYGKAENWYAQAAKFDKKLYPHAQYYYGVTLRYMANYDAAAQQFDQFLASYKKNDNFSEQAKLELANIKFIKEQLAKKDLNLYKVDKQSANGEGATYAAFPVANGLMFTSTRADALTYADSKKKSPYVNNLYQQVNGLVEKLNVPNADNMEQGVASFTADGSKMYFTKWSAVNGKNIAAIYTSEKQGDTWSAPVKLGANVNMEGHSAKQPSVTADGKYLLFSSNRPGGKGKYDLWYASLNNGEAGKATNMGAINTKEDDEAPFYHQPSATLVFASNGRVGMGGFDLYETKGSIGSTWGEPANLGFPINTHKDDTYFYSAGTQLLKNAGVSSDRNSTCCLELYSVNKTYRKYVTGIVNDCKTNQPLSGVSLQLNNGSLAPGLTTANNGNYILELEAFTQVRMEASKAEYQNATINFYKPDTDADTLYNAMFCLTPNEKVVVVEEPEVEPPTDDPKEKEMLAYFEYEKYDLKPETQQMLETLAGLLSREKMLGLDILGYTDNKGTNAYNLNLSRLRALACKDYLIKQGIAANRLKVTAKGECCPLQPETINGVDNPAGREANRRVEFKIIVVQ